MNKYSEILVQLKSEFIKNKLIYIFIIVSTLLLHFSLYLLLNSKSSYSITTYIDTLFVICIRTFLVWSAYEYIKMFLNKTPKPTLALLKKIKSLLNPKYKPISFFTTLLLLNITFSSYTHIKTLIPNINPYYLDFTLFELDKKIHFGLSPWEITHSIFSSNLSTIFIDFLYQLWFLIIWGFLLFFILYKKDNNHRNQFMLTFLSCWVIIGTVMATWLSSVGPCYIHLLDNSQTQYIPLLKLLDTQSSFTEEHYYYSLQALKFQSLLWDSFINENNALGAGISAMPSMHVSMATLLSLSTYKLNKTLCFIMWVYTLFIQIGSVHLAWHYALDGYVSILVTTIIWYVWGMTINRLNR